MKTAACVVLHHVPGGVDQNYLEAFVGKTVLVRVRNHERYQLFGLYGDTASGRLVACDELGAWFENPAWEHQHDEDAEHHRVHFLVRWEDLQSALVFPEGHEDGGVGDRDVRRIGFEV